MFDLRNVDWNASGALVLGRFFAVAIPLGGLESIEGVAQSGEHLALEEFFANQVSRLGERLQLFGTCVDFDLGGIVLGLPSARHHLPYTLAITKSGAPTLTLATIQNLLSKPVRMSRTSGCVRWSCMRTAESSRQPIRRHTKRGLSGSGDRSSSAACHSAHCAPSLKNFNHALRE